FFDGQSAIIGRKRKVPAGPLSPENAWIGQNPETAFREIARWISPDPGIVDLSLTLAERRQRLAADGVKLLAGPPCPTSLTAGPCLNGYRESVIWEDVSLDQRARRDRIRAAPPAFQRNVAVDDDRDEGHAVKHAPR